MALQEEMEKQGNWLFRYRGVLPIFILLIGVGLFLQTKFEPETFFIENTRIENPYLYGCLLVSLLGLFIRVYTVGHSAENTSGRNTKGQIADSLNTTGIYSIVRHPLYLGNFLMWLGPALLTGNFWFVVSFTLFYMLYYERIMFAEEQFLRRKFGAVYTNWAETVPPFIPSFKKFSHPRLPFSWKKVIKNEKAGILYTFLIFTILQWVGKIIQKDFKYDYFLIGCCAVVILYYIVIKIIAKSSSLLHEKGR